MMATQERFCSEVPEGPRLKSTVNHGSHNVLAQLSLFFSPNYATRLRWANWRRVCHVYHLTSNRKSETEYFRKIERWTIPMESRERRALSLDMQVSL